LREKSLKVTAYLEYLLTNWPMDVVGGQPYAMLTPRTPKERGAQISVRLEEGLLEGVMEYLEEHGIVVDERTPDVVRVAPAPLYNGFEDCWQFMEAFHQALVRTKAKQRHDTGGMMGVPKNEGDTVR
jgi:kynureninase